MRGPSQLVRGPGVEVGWSFVAGAPSLSRVEPPDPLRTVREACEADDRNGNGPVRHGREGKKVRDGKGSGKKGKM